MIRQQWGKFENRVNSLSLRERALIFLAAAFILVSVAKTFVLDSLLLQKKKLSAEIESQQEMVKSLQAEIDDAIQARKDLENSAQQHRLTAARQELAEGNTYLQRRSDSLVPPEKVAELLEQVLGHNEGLQLVDLKTLPAEPLLDEAQKKQGASNMENGDTVALDKQVFKHGVVITIRGSYLDLLQYVTELEKLPMQMFWGKAEMRVIRYPDVELSLTVYTLSLEKTWLQI